MNWHGLSKGSPLPEGHLVTRIQQMAGEHRRKSGNADEGGEHAHERRGENVPELGDLNFDL